MQIDKHYNLYCIELISGKRVLCYDTKLWHAIYIYNGNTKIIPMDVDRWHKTLEKYHRLKIDCIKEKLIAPIIKVESEVKE